MPGSQAGLKEAGKEEQKWQRDDTQISSLIFPMKKWIDPSSTRSRRKCRGSWKWGCVCRYPLGRAAA